MRAKRASLVALVVLVLLGSTGCGKYGKPLPPEFFAPAEVRELAVTPSVQGVTFDWRAPEDNARGKTLEDLQGYRIYRRELSQGARLLDNEARFELIGTVEDTQLKELIELKKQAREQGQLTRRITLPPERSKFQFVDRTAVLGKRYLYQVVPFNQGGVEGVVIERINVLFRGEISEVARIPYSAEEFQF